MASKETQGNLGKNEQKVTDDFLKAIQKDGMHKVLVWADQWYDDLAKARLKDQMAAANPAVSPRNIPLWQETRAALDLINRVQRGAHSSSPSANMMANAEMRALAYFADNEFREHAQATIQSGIDEQKTALPTKK